MHGRVIACALAMSASLMAPPLRDRLATAQAPAAAAVYGAVLAQAHPDGLPAVVIVENLTVPLPPMHGADALWLRGVETVPAALRQQTGWSKQQSVALADDLLLPPVRLMRADDIQAMFTGGIEEGWAAFRRSTGADG